MQVTKKAFQAVLKAVAPIIGNNPAIPILECVKLEAGKITATDLNVTVQANFLFNPSLMEFAPICVPFKDFNAIIDACGDSIELESDPSTLKITIRSGKYMSTITGENVADFPAIPEKNPGETVTLTNDDVRFVATHMVGFASTDELRPAFMGIMFDGTNFVATDAHRLIHYTVDGGGQHEQTIIPVKVFKTLNTLISHTETVTFFKNKLTEKHEPAKCFFTTDDFTIGFQVIDGKYPDYDAVIPKTFTGKIAVDRAELGNAIRFTGITANTATHAIRLNASGSSIEVSSEDLDFGRKSVGHVDASVSSDIVIGVNGKFAAASIGTFDDHEIVLNYNEPNRPIVFNAPNAQHRVLLMPLMLNP